jgi:hypothetical protein
LCNGKTLAFQAKDAGSIPAARSILLSWKVDRLSTLDQELFPLKINNMDVGIHDL